MKSFLTFLAEQWSEYSSGVNSHRVVHNAQIGPHKVSVYFRGEKNGTYGVDYSVDGRLDAMKGQNNPHAHAIAKHVMGRVEDFVKTHKPRSLTMVGNTTKKDKLYDRFQQRLARKFGGRVDPDFNEVFLRRAQA